MVLKTLYIPDNLDIEALAGWNSIPTQKLAYFLTRVYVGRWNRAIGHSGYVPLKMEYLRKALGQKGAQQVRDFAVESGIIECDGKAVPRAKAFGYRFTAAYRDRAFVPFAAIDPRKVNVPQPVPPSTPQQRYLVRNLKRVTLDPAIWGYLDERAFESRFSEDFYRRSAEWIDATEWWFSSDPRTGRVFNNVTSFPKALRPFLRLDGQPLVEIDVANCQPLLLAWLYGACGATDEANRYRDWVTSGQFYENLRKAAKCNQSRADVKTAFYRQVLFGKMKRRTKLLTTFEREFPCLTEKIKWMKDTWDYREVARFLQISEAHLVIDKTVGRLMRDQPIPLLTIHDSILTTAAHVGKVSSALKDSFANHLGVLPPLKLTDYGEAA